MSVTKLDNDLLWTVAHYEVLSERDISARDTTYSPGQRSVLQHYMTVVIPEDKELSAEYGGILECQFDYYDSSPEDF